TPVFQWLGMPFIPLLELMQVPYATEASETILIGFADMFLPSVVGASIESEMTRFIIAALSVTQLIYMSEVGGVLLCSKVPSKYINNNKRNCDDNFNCFTTWKKSRLIRCDIGWS